jgi:ABC-type Mn2+/Zn2+ transport system permease subunit
MNTLNDILSPSFVLRDALLASVLVGLVCPLVGVYFVLRRMIFLGVALPQVSAAGIAFSFLAYKMAVGPHDHMEVSERLLAVVGSLLFTLTTTLVLALMERRGRETVEARIGTTYAVAAAATILFLAKDPHGDAQMVNLLKGDILATTETSLRWIAEIFALVVLLLLAFRKELLLVSFDRDLAIVFGKHAGLWDVVLYLLIGVVISLGVMTAGPMATFGFLVIPPVTVRLVARRMITFSLGSAAMGAVTAFAGFYCAYRYDLPLGPAEVGVASIVLGVVAALTGLCSAATRWRSMQGP